MFWFITGIVFVLIAAGWFAFGPKYYVTNKEYTSLLSKNVPLKWIGYIPLFLGILLMILSCFTVVGTRNVGVPTVFNKTTGETYGAGIHFKAPWVAVTDVDASIHPEEYGPNNPIEVKIADGGDAKILLSYRWRINPDGADSVFKDYRNSELGIDKAVRKALVSTNIKAAINEELGNFDPLSSAGELTAGMSAEQLANLKVNVVPDYQALNKAIQKNVEEKIANVGDLIDIQSITISGLKLPKSTQRRINKFNNQVQDTRNALQEVATKKAQAAGNRELANSLKDPNVLVSKCFDSLAAGEFTLPAGGSCWPGQGGVVLPAR